MVKYKHLVMMGLAGGALATLSIGCGKVTPEAPNITADMSVVAEGSTFSDGTLDPLGAKLKISLSGLDGFTLQEPPAGCKDTVSATEEHGYGGWFQPAWSPYSCPNPEIDENIEQADWDSKGHLQVFVNGVYVGDGYSSEFSLPFLQKGLYYYASADLLGIGLDNFSAGSNLDGDGVITPWADPLNLLRASSYGLYFGYSGHDATHTMDTSSYCNLLLPMLDKDSKDGDVRYLTDLFGLVTTIAAVDSSACPDYKAPAFYGVPDFDGDGLVGTAVESDTDGDKVFELAKEVDTDADGHLDVKEDADSDGRIDNNEDTDGDGLPGIKIATWGTTDLYALSEDLDGDGHLDGNEDDNGNGEFDCDEDDDGDGNFDGLDTDGDGFLDSGEDVDEDGVIDVTTDVDSDKDGRIDGFKVLSGTPFQTAELIFATSEDLDGDGKLDTNEDLDRDGKFSTEVEDIDADGVQDTNESFYSFDCDNEFGCEGDDVYLVTSADILLDQGELWDYRYFRLNGQYEADYCADETMYNVVTVKFVHDDHSPVYGAPVLKYELSSADLATMHLLPSALTNADGKHPGTRQ